MNEHPYNDATVRSSAPPRETPSLRSERDSGCPITAVGKFRCRLGAALLAVNTITTFKGDLQASPEQSPTKNLYYSKYNQKLKFNDRF
jgi:hypothetical protein